MGGGKGPGLLPLVVARRHEGLVQWKGLPSPQITAKGTVGLRLWLTGATVHRSARILIDCRDALVKVCC
jgi:hypothetical protein